jgi:hypothetical protein
MISLLVRWRVLRAVGELLRSVGGALDDSDLSEAERAIIKRRFWAVIETYRGKHRRLDG